MYLGDVLNNKIWDGNEYTNMDLFACYEYFYSAAMVMMSLRHLKHPFARLRQRNRIEWPWLFPGFCRKI